MTNTYSNRKRVSPEPPAAQRLLDQRLWLGPGRAADERHLPAGAFGYTYAALDCGYLGPAGASSWVCRVALYITNYLTRSRGCWAPCFKSSGGSTLDSALYGYNLGNERPPTPTPPAAYVQYSYDPIGQLTVARARSAAKTVGYAYDKAWNLQ